MHHNEEMKLRIEQVNTTSEQVIQEELSRGLLSERAFISPKYLYDELGSRLFEAITALPEYTPCRDERAIFDSALAQVLAEVPRDAALIDLGAGSCRKGAMLLAPLAVRHYIAIDISTAFLQGSLELMTRDAPEIQMTGLGLDFSSGLPPGILDAHLEPRMMRVFFFAGSSIGNFHPHEAEEFLRGLVLQHAAAAIIIGVDLVRDIPHLEAAYDDALGVTAAFNRNLLLHLNARLQADFRLADWQHRALFNTDQSRIEMHLVAQEATQVNWGERSRAFERGEFIHTENSYKYTAEEFRRLLQRAGFDSVRETIHPSGRYALLTALTDRNPAKASLR